MATVISSKAGQSAPNQPFQVSGGRHTLLGVCSWTRLNLSNGRGSGLLCWGWALRECWLPLPWHSVFSAPAIGGRPSPVTLSACSLWEAFLGARVLPVRMLSDIWVQV